MNTFPSHTPKERNTMNATLESGSYSTAARLARRPLLQWFGGLMMALGLVLTGCGSENTVEPQDTAEPSCTPGFLGCDCIDGTACFPGSEWVCLDDICREPVCEVGEEGCACFPNNTCGAGQDGAPLQCTDGLCEVAPCTAGTSGCPCTELGECESGLECSALDGRSVCAEPGCEVGAEGCPCEEDRGCGPTLLCHKNTCISPNCTAGTEDCFCRQDLGCNAGLECNGEELCEAIGCTEGSLGCECRDGACDAPDAFCDELGICQEANCLAGNLGCACLNGTDCATVNGEQLFCEDGLCRSSDCVPGDVACVCAEGSQCADGAQCQAGVCVEADCQAGSENCTCQAGACFPGLRCREDNICADATGFIDGPCLDNGTCQRGGRCDDDLCVRCTLGTPGCGCNDADSCFSGAVCVADTCLAEADLPPEVAYERTCYTPCKSDLDPENGQICGTDNLMPGCIGGRTCDGSTCLLEGEPAPTCESEFDCPFWQTCVDGQCHSECDDASHCTAGKSCYKHVCRVACDLNTPCPNGQNCDTEDAETGFCVPALPNTGESILEVPGSFSLSRTTVSFDNTSVTNAVTIINDSGSYETFILRKHSDLVLLEDGTARRSRRAADGRILCDFDDAPEGTCECILDQQNRPTDDCFCAGDDCFCTDDRDCESGYSCDDGACRPDQCVGDTCPMAWLSMGVLGDDLTQIDEMEVGVEAGGSTTVQLGNAADVVGVRWQGTIEVVNPSLGTQLVDLSYTEVPEGQWAGTMVYLSDFGTAGLEEWRVNQTTRDDDAKIDQLGNAMLQIWGTFRRGRLELDELQAMLTATQTGSWKYQNVMDACETEACYLYDIGQSGLVTFSNDLDTVPVPTGAVELPVALNLYQPDPENNPGQLAGRIESSKSLQYAGNPAIEINFATSPNDCDLPGGVCVAFIDSMQSEVFVGGRYAAQSGDLGCTEHRAGDDYQLFGVPWLVPGFENSTGIDEETGLRYRYECRDSLLPFQSTDPNEQSALGPLNADLALSNPIPDGRARKRTLTLLDGAMINQSQMVIFFEEKFESFVEGQEGITAYGFMTLQRRATDLEDEDANANDVADVFEGTTPFDRRTEPTDVLSPQCSSEILAAIPGVGSRISSSNVLRVVTAVMDGVASGDEPEELGVGSDEQVHYFCEDTGQINGGSDIVAEPCPAGSNVEFFTLNRNFLNASEIRGLACQDSDAGCAEQVERWRNANVMIQQDPIFRCADEDRVYCNDNRLDLRADKVFFAAGEEEAVFVPLQVLIDEAFRYKTRFQNRDGQGIGFAPEVCEAGSNAIPYCYDPAQIEEIQARIDCLLHIHQEWYGALSGSADKIAARGDLDEYLAANFALDREVVDGFETTRDGFERQLSQLLIMLGDEAFTQAFASRFDLAAINTAAFEGSLFEVDGINLSGAVGFEMVSLYKAAQYYQMVLDRLYANSPVIWDAIEYGQTPRNFVDADMVLNYLDRVIRASTQKGRTWGEIAKRYQNIGRPDLARSVAERAYTATYLESIVIGRMMLDISDAVLNEDRDGVVNAVDNAQLRYKSALLDMESIYSQIDDNITIFGFAPDFIPFPALDSEDFRQSNAFEVFLLRARNKMQFAREREDLALNQGREFETNQAQFQSELTNIRNNFETQLGDVCGTFIGVDDRVYPAIKKYAHLSERTTVLGEPCGLVGNGQIHDAMASFEGLLIEAQTLRVQVENVLEEVDIEQDRVSAQCDEILEAADFLYGKCERSASEEFLDALNPFGEPDETGCIQAQVNNLQADIRNNQFVINRLQQVQSVLATSTSLSKCSGADCPSALVSVSTFLAGTALTELGISAVELGINEREKDIAELERFKMQWQTENDCDLAKVESEARVRSILLRLKELELESLRLEYRTRQALGELQRLRNAAKRLEGEQAETEQLAINVQAAHNNPNVRIYKNDAIINAEIAFDDAIREVYKLTRVFEYYTSTSYAKKNDLFLTRMIARGDKNLENYVVELENAFFEFEEFFGHPSTRVMRLTLRDNIFNIPLMDEYGRALNEGDRTELMRERLTDRKLLDKNGYLTIPFSTNLEQLSPLTRNHKILRIQADLHGNNLGDPIARVYIRQKGTGTIKSVEGDKQFHRFDERTAVINTLFANNQIFDNAVYQDFRLRDRPLVNTHWELVINQRDEAVNQDVDLSGLTDIRLYIYYTDVTVF